MIKSMTAFGRAERITDDSAFVAEIRCLNRRYCEISVRLPHKLLALEDRVKKLVKKRIARGRVDVTVKIKSGSEPVPEIDLNIPLAKVYHKALNELAEVLKLKEGVALETLLRIEGIVTAIEPDVDLERMWDNLSICVDEALDSVEDMRIAEGSAIYEDFQLRLHNVEEGINALKTLAPSVLSEYQDRLTERIKVLTEGKVELDPNRLAQEAAFLADKSDVTEELVRATSHLKQFRSMIASNESAGRALDFLLQELNREVNTIGSKAGDAELSQLVVTIKSELEKIREQVQNVE